MAVWIGRLVDKFSTEEDLLHAVHAQAADSVNVIFTRHARERMEEREILDADVLRILQRGDLKGRIEKEKEGNGWKLKIVYLLRGNREAGVVTIVYSNSPELRVVTVEWEDLP